MSVKRFVVGCFGRNPRDGKRVGQRHRWENGWGVGYCRYCDRALNEVLMADPAPTIESGKGE